MAADKQTIGAQVRKSRVESGLTQRQLADRVHTTGATINRLENGINCNPRLLRDVATVLHLAPLTELESMVASVTEGSDWENNDYVPQHAREQLSSMRHTSGHQVPVVSWAKAGAARDYQDLASFLDETLETDCKDPNAFALIVEGDSMEPALRAGDRVVVLPNSEARNGDIVVARRRETHEVYVKLFHRTGPQADKVRLTSYNTLYPPLEFELTDFRFIYPIHSMVRKYRHH